MAASFNECLVCFSGGIAVFLMTRPAATAHGSIRLPSGITDVSNCPVDPSSNRSSFRNSVKFIRPGYRATPAGAIPKKKRRIQRLRIKIREDGIDQLFYRYREASVQYSMETAHGTLGLAVCRFFTVMESAIMVAKVTWEMPASSSGCHPVCRIFEWSLSQSTGRQSLPMKLSPLR